MSKQTKNTLPESTIIEVVMRKEMTLYDFNKMKSGARAKGWKVKSFQIGVYSEGIEKEIKNIKK